MEALIPGIVVSFREGLEAFLILILIFKFLEKTKNTHLKSSVIYGLISSIIFSLCIGFFLFFVGKQLEKMEEMGDLWESIASFIAVGLITSCIIWMIKHGSEIKEQVEQEVTLNLTKKGIYIISLLLISREGVEIAIFAFAGQYHPLSLGIGIGIAFLLALGMYYSFLKINISSLFKVTLVYLIFQTGYLLGNGVHEAFSILESFGYIDPNNVLLVRAFDFSETLLNHEEGAIGIPLNILFGWHSDPEWIPFLTQYSFVIAFFAYWQKQVKI
ncbi:MAG: FTR1 family protein [Candidatus Peregrinibacteria bacterium]